MTKRILTVLALFCAMIGGMSAQFKNGNWNTHSVFGSAVSTVVESQHYVFFLADNNLYRFNKSTAELTHQSKRNGMSDNSVAEIYYNYRNDFTVVVYESTNIDVVAPDGSVTNIPCIADIVLTSPRTVNDVTFADDRMYVATDFGYIVYSFTERKVIDSNVYFSAVKSAAEIGNEIWLSTEGGLFSTPAHGNHASLSAFSLRLSSAKGLIRPLSARSFLLVGDSKLNLATLSDNNVPQLSTLLQATDIKLQLSEHGAVAKSASSPTMLIIDNNGNTQLQCDLSGDDATSVLGNIATDGSLWELNANGVRRMKTGNSGIEALSDYHKPQASSFSRARHLLYNRHNDELWASTGGVDDFGNSIGALGSINTLKNGVWENITPAKMPNTNASSKKSQLQDIYSPVFDPDAPGTMVFGTWYEGVYVVTDGKATMKYDWNNSPIVKKGGWSCLATGVDFDKDKNLYVAHLTDKGYKLSMLPRNKQNTPDITAADWVNVNADLSAYAGYRCHLVATKVSGTKVFDSGGYESEMMFIDDSSNPVATRRFVSFFDTEGKPFKATYHYFIYEDAKGMVWLGTSDGVINFNPAEAFSPDFRVNRFIVAGTDGSSSYLLANEDASCMSIDDNGNIWFGTLSSGIYRVNSSCSKIIAHYTSDNSMLTTDRILSICCKPDGSAVYIGTENGIVEFLPDATAGEVDFSRVEVSPSNVPSGYTGFVLIDKLMSGATVTITDRWGNTVANITADGGKALWDLCNTAGKKVATGKYLIYASTKVGDRGELVGKINIIR